MPMTVAEKVLARAAGTAAVSPGQVVRAVPDLVIVHDAYPRGGGRPPGSGVPMVWVPEPGIVGGGLEARPAEGVGALPAGGGACHTVAMEEGLILPSRLVLGPVPHVQACGAVGALGMGLPPGGASCLAAAGFAELVVPPSVRVVLRRTLVPPASVYDVALSLGHEAYAGCAVEFHGSVGTLSMDDRLTLASIVAAAGAAAALFPVDHARREWLALRGVGPDSYEALWADVAATYERELTLDLREVVPMGALGHEPAVPVRDLRGNPVDLAIIGGNGGATREEIASAAAVLGGRKVAPGVRLVVVPGSGRVLVDAMASGHVQVLTRAGAWVTPPGCDPWALGIEGARAISTGPWPQRPGVTQIVASPLTVACTALAGAVVDPREGPG